MTSRKYRDPFGKGQWPHGVKHLEGFDHLFCFRCHLHACSSASSPRSIFSLFITSLISFRCSVIFYLFIYLNSHKGRYLLLLLSLCALSCSCSKKNSELGWRFWPKGTWISVGKSCSGLCAWANYISNFAENRYQQETAYLFRCGSDNLLFHCGNWYKSINSTKCLLISWYCRIEKGSREMQKFFHK